MLAYLSRLRPFFLPTLFVLLLSCFASSARAQGITTGTISGTVTDQSGAVVPGAAISATSTDTGITLETKATETGVFTFRVVPIGNYKLQVTASGFQATQISAVAVRAGATADVKEIPLAVSGAAEHVEVNGAEAQLLNTTDAQVTTTLSSQQISTLPLNNGFDTAAELIPGVVSTHADGFSNTNGDNFSLNGQSGRFNNFELDGQSNNDNGVGGPQIFFGSQDAIAEFQVITNSPSAQYGRNAGAVVNYITKSGSNTFHGSGFEIYQGSFLSSLQNEQKSPVFGFCAPGEDPNATGCAVVQVPRSVENRYGGTIGGPILKDKLFFFGSTFWDRVRTGASPESSGSNLTPTPNGLQQLQAAFPGNPAVGILTNYGPYGVTLGNPRPVASGLTTEVITGPGGVNATIEVAPVQRLVPSIFNDEENLGRVDWQPTPKDHLFVRYFYQNQLLTAATGSSDIASGSWGDNTDIAHSVGADWSHTFTDHLVDQLRYSFQQTRSVFQGGADPKCTISTFDSCPAFISFGSSQDDESFGYDYALPQGAVVKVTQVQNNATWSHGNHTLLFGGEFTYQNSPNTYLPYYQGYYNFSTLSNFISGGPLAGQDATAASLNLTDGNPVTKITEVDAAGYIQDDWKVTPSFTAHIGLRWEFLSQPFNILHSETVARESNPATAFWDPSLPLSVRTVPNVNNYYRNYQPRIGFAWNPQIYKNLVIRGGYSINSNPAFYNIYVNDADSAPVANAGTIYCGNGTNCVPANANFTAGSVRSTNLGFLSQGDPGASNVSIVNSNFRPPYTQTYTLALEHQIGRIGVAEFRYVGSLTEKNFQSIDGNPYVAPVAAAFPSYLNPSSLCQDPDANGTGRPNCAYSNLSYIGNGGWANYNGLQVNVQTRAFHGVTSSVSYTYSKAIDNATDAFRSTGTGGSSIAFPQNPLNPDQGERGLSGNDFRQAVGLQFDYQLPRLPTSSTLVGRWLNGFELNGIYRFNTGQPYTPYQNIGLDPYTPDTSLCDAPFNAATIGADTCRPVVSNKKAPLGTVAYLNPYTGPVVDGAPTQGNPEWVAYGSDTATADENGNLTSYYPGNPIDPASARWIVNNQAYAQSVGNPFPGWSRGIYHGTSYSDLDLTLLKTTAITERVSLQLSIAGYNLLNQMYFASPNTALASSSFGSYAFNSTGGNVPGNASGNRFFNIGGKIIF